MSTFPLFKKCTECRIKCESMNPHTPSSSPGPHSITCNPGVRLSFQPPLFFFFSYGGNAWLLAQWSALLPYAVFQKAFHISTLVPLILNCLYPFSTWKDFSRGRLAKALVYLHRFSLFLLVTIHFAHFFLNNLSFSHWFIEVSVDTWVILVKILNIQSDWLSLLSKRLDRDEVKLLRGCFIVYVSGPSLFIEWANWEAESYGT